MKHPKTTLAGFAQSAGWLLAGIALYSDLSGLPKSLTLAKLGLAGFAIIAVAVAVHGWHSADKQD